MRLRTDDRGPRREVYSGSGSYMDDWLPACHYGNIDILFTRVQYIQEEDYLAFGRKPSLV
jgi:hypothetical protein